MTRAVSCPVARAASGDPHHADPIHPADRLSGWQWVFAHTLNVGSSTLCHQEVRQVIGQRLVLSCGLPYLLSAVVSLPTPMTSAQETTPSWFIGEWAGSLIHPFRLRMQILSLTVRDDGTCSGAIHRGGADPGSGAYDRFSCKWKLSAVDEMILDASFVKGSKTKPFQWTLRKRDDAIEGNQDRLRLNRSP